jgi:hypothetical protein
VKNRDLAKLDNFPGSLVSGRDDGIPAVPPLLHSSSRGAAQPDLISAPGAILVGLVAATVLVYLGRQIVRMRAGDPVNLPKFLLFAGVVPLHWLTFAYMSWQAAVPTVTIVHNVQYHALIWFHNRNRYGGAKAAESHGRIPRAVSRSLLSYALVALVFSAAYRVPGLPAWAGLRPGVRLLLRIRPDALLSGQQDLARAAAIPRCARYCSWRKLVSWKLCLGHPLAPAAGPGTSDACALTLRYCMQTEVHVYALAVAASALLSFYPFLVVMLSFCRNVLRWPAAADAIYLALNDYLPGDLGAFLKRNLPMRGTFQFTSMFLLLLTANGVFEPLEVALNRAWGVAKIARYLKNQLVSLGMIFLCGGLALLSLILST